MKKAVNPPSMVLKYTLNSVKADLSAAIKTCGYYASNFTIFRKNSTWYLSSHLNNAESAAEQCKTVIIAAGYIYQAVELEHGILPVKFTAYKIEAN